MRIMFHENELFSLMSNLKGRWGSHVEFGEGFEPATHEKAFGNVYEYG